MELSILITLEIGSMFIMIFVGYILAERKIVQKNVVVSLSKIVMNVVLPCTIIRSFQIEFNSKILNGFLFALFFSLIGNTFLVLSPYLLRKKINLTPIEQASISYPNSGEILIPLVISILSKEMHIYCSTFIIVQIVFMFTHGVSLISGYKKNKLTDIFKNANVISMIIGFILFLFNIEIPNIIYVPINSFANMLAPMCMLLIGISIEGISMRKAFGKISIYKVPFIRLVFLPLIFLFFIKLTGLINNDEHTNNILLVIFMAIASSPAATIVNLASNYNKDVESASLINIVCTLFLVVTFPVMIILFTIFT